MSGLLLMGVWAVWLIVAFACATVVGAFFKTKWLRFAVSILVFMAMLPLPVADELLAKPAFDKLCEEGTKLKFDPEKIRGKTIYLLEGVPASFKVGSLSGTMVPWRYADTTTKEVLISYGTYGLKGGVLIRMLGISETSAPLAIRNSCAPVEGGWQKPFLERNQLTYVEREDVK